MARVEHQESAASGLPPGAAVSWGFSPRARDSLRYERKFTCDDGRPFLESLVRLHPALFGEIHHRRWVNNIYFDTRGLASYEDNVDGESRLRIKVRIRWYGDLLGLIERPVLELKIKRGIVNWKEQFPLATFAIDESMSIGAIRDLLQRSGSPEYLTLSLQNLHPTLVNRYSRNYFQTPDHLFRLTIDSDLEFHAISAHYGGLGAVLGIDTVILELKYGLDQATAAADLTQYLPLRVARSSKYATGIDRLRARSFHHR